MGIPYTHTVYLGVSHFLIGGLQSLLVTQTLIGRLAAFRASSVGGHEQRHRPYIEPEVFLPLRRSLDRGRYHRYPLQTGHCGPCSTSPRTLSRTIPPFPAAAKHK